MTELRTKEQIVEDILSYEIFEFIIEKENKEERRKFLLEEIDEADLFDYWMNI